VGIFADGMFPVMFSLSTYNFCNFSPIYQAGTVWAGKKEAETTIGKKQ